ncbi:copper amine oxidase N-terminal domain-containing protein [Ammonifex thiophilus]|uniref:Copper amine oxidase N-terminal domain-containing protein n=1 Tax=Ammonifex thiophilus TaxID=444093 RepID=A0A3D8P3J1_9THEO|nr:copper amine oxidase N-terminal domain-containing protein [Ammonifex thiophilus]RDV81204.1 copper amine oxidase N-terminal domain-containing protein [Ammonifex thiophilus]
MLRRCLSVGVLVLFLLSVLAAPVLAKPRVEKEVKVRTELRNEGEEQEVEARVETEEREGNTVAGRVYEEKEGKEKKERKEERERKEKEERKKESVEKKVYGEHKIEFAGVVTAVYGDTLTVVKGGIGYQKEETFTLTPSTKIVLVGHLKKEYTDPMEALKEGAMVKIKADAEGKVKVLRILPARKGEALGVVAVVYGDREITFDVPPFIENGRTMVPVRKVAEALGLQVDFDKETGQVTITNPANGKTVIFFLGSRKYLVDGQEKEMEVEAREISGRTVIPVRYMGEALGRQVDYVNGVVDIE